MTRVITATVLSTFLVVGAAAAQTPPATAPATPPAAPAPAPAVPFPADARIGFVNMQQVVDASQLGRAGVDRLRTLSEQKATEIGTKEKEAQTLQQEIQSGQNVLAASVIAQRTAELDRRNRELQFLREQAQVDIEALRSELLDEFGEKVLPIVEQIRAERSLWVIFSLGEGSGVSALNPGLDLSAEVVRRLDATK